MMFCPENIINGIGSYLISNTVNAIAHTCLNKTVITEFWHNFTYRSSTLTVTETTDYVFSIGNTEKIPLDGYEYTVNIDSNGICVYAESEKSLICGFMTLLDRLQAIDGDEGTAVKLDFCQIRDKAQMKNRMVHFCIFPETELWELHRFVRFCAALRYTHVILEFWGMLKYDCMKELSWSHGFTKEEVKPIIKEANELGLEVIPMFNHWGHASAGRVMHGKHVVLDQNPSLQSYFSESGWCWDISKPKVKALLRKIRIELMELCGNGKYFHIGCDEAYNYSFTKEGMDDICDFLNEIGTELQAYGRRAIVWSDMFLYRYPHYNPKNFYECNAPSPEAEQYMLSRLQRHLIIADWQYEIKVAPEETAPIFKNAGFDCLLCPYDKGMPQMNSIISTAKELGLMGFIHTTWHTLSSGFPFVTVAAVTGFENRTVNHREVRANSAALLRKVYPVNGDYRKAGWSKIQIGCRW